MCWLFEVNKLLINSGLSTEKNYKLFYFLFINTKTTLIITDYQQGIVANFVSIEQK